MNCSTRHGYTADWMLWMRDDAPPNCLITSLLLCCWWWSTNGSKWSCSANRIDTETYWELPGGGIGGGGETSSTNLSGHRVSVAPPCTTWKLKFFIHPYRGAMSWCHVLFSHRSVLPQSVCSMSVSPSSFSISGLLMSFLFHIWLMDMEFLHRRRIVINI